MKKKIALLILLALALTLILTACRQPDATKIIPRWSTEGESYVYDVKLADFAETGNKRFASYTNPADKDAYYKDYLIRAGEPLDSLDEVRPVSVEGTYTLTTSHLADDKYDRVETKQELYVTYELQDGKLKLGENMLVQLSDKFDEFIVKTESNRITLKSTTETMVEFKRNDNGKQAPVKSGTSVDGFYVGKAHQEVSKYEIATEYKYESKKTVAEIKLTTYKYDESQKAFTIETSELSDEMKRRTEGTFIDSNQLFMYTRSFDKTSTSFADSPSVTVYNPLNQELQTASFSFTAAANVYLTNGSNNLYAKLPMVSVVVGGMPFMIQMSAPKLLDEKDQGPDRAKYGTEYYAKHTPVRFRVGYLSYELQYEVGTPQNELWNALTSYAESKK